MVNNEQIFKETILEAKKEEKPEKKEGSSIVLAKIAFNPKQAYPLYTVRIPREIARQCEIKKGDSLAFTTSKDKYGKTLLKAELVRYQNE